MLVIGKWKRETTVELRDFKLLSWIAGCSLLFLLKITIALTFVGYRCIQYTTGIFLGTKFSNEP